MTPAKLKKALLLSGIILAFIVGFAFTFPKPAPQPDLSPTMQVHGELIEPSPAPETNSAIASATSPKHKHPKPPPVQTRMLLAQLVQSNPANAGDAAMPAGTLGNAADLAKTNLVFATGLPANFQPLPGYPEITFATLGGFDFKVPQELTGGATPAQVLDQARAQLPPAIQSLDGKKAVILGYILPVRMDDGLAVDFLLMRNQSMCCYGVPPKINEWITVHMTGKGVEPKMDQPIAVVGTLHVGPTQEGGFLTGIYSMDGEKTLGPF